MTDPPAVLVNGAKPLDDDATKPSNDPVVLTPLVVPRRTGIRLQHLMYAVVGCALLFWLAMLTMYTLILGLIVGWAVLTVAFAVILARRNASQRESLLWALAIASERGMPLAPAALAFADQYGVSYRWRVQLLAALLDEGKTLPEAMSQVPGLFDREASVMIRAGWATGTLSGALRQAAARRAQRGGDWGGLSSKLAYVVTLLLAMQTVVGFVAYFIMPKFEAIFRDFGIPLPGITIFTIEASHVLGGYGGLVVIPLVLLELLTLTALSMGFFNLFQLQIPVIDRIFLRRHAALICRALALSVEADKPIGPALEALANEYPSGWVRRRLRSATLAVNHGQDWVHALLNQKLIRRTEAALLLSSRRVGNLAWALNEAAASSERRAGYRFRVLLEILFPVAIALMGLVVFVVGVGYFYPLVTLIERLAG